MPPQRRIVAKLASLDATANLHRRPNRGIDRESSIVQAAVMSIRICRPRKSANGAEYGAMKPRLPILLSAVLLAVAILLVFKDELHAHDPHGLAEPTECGFWGPMSAGMSCR